jgi:hypothetical protein
VARITDVNHYARIQFIFDNSIGPLYLSVLHEPYR